MCAGILNCGWRRAAGALFFGALVLRGAAPALVPVPEREGVFLAAAEERDFPPSILDQVGGVDLAALGGDFFAADDWAI
jgi:hypothetical protein